ncbi:hypothetical protein EON64_05405, partial [archaeon]
MSDLYDIPDLKDRIRKFKAQQAELKSEKESLLAEIEVKERKVAALRQELTVAAPNEALRFLPDDDDDGNSLDHKKFLMMNEKLDLQILIQEVRNALPQLEQEVKIAEAAARIDSKSIQQTSKHIANISENKSLYTRPIADLKTLIQDNVDQLVRLRGDQAIRTESLKRENQELINKISTSRREITRLIQEKNALEKNILSLNTLPSLDEERLKIALQHQKEVRDRLQRFHDGYGWQVEAFRLAGGKEGGKVAIGKLPSVLRDWIIVENRTLNWCHENYLQRILQDIVYGDDVVESPRHHV